jgi:hypothetical protein
MDSKDDERKAYQFHHQDPLRKEEDHIEDVKTDPSDAIEFIDSFVMDSHEYLENLILLVLCFKYKHLMSRVLNSWRRLKRTLVGCLVTSLVLTITSAGLLPREASAAEKALVGLSAPTHEKTSQELLNQTKENTH